MPRLSVSPSLRRLRWRAGPDGIADVAEKVIDAVVNISTSQTVDARPPTTTRVATSAGNRRGANPQLPPDSPFSEFFDEFFKNRRGGPGGGNSPRKVNSLGSGFIIDTDGTVVTNNHVIADADEINVILNDGTKIKAELIGKDKKSDLAVLKFTPPEKKLTAVKFGNSDNLRLGEWVIAIGNPFSLGGTVTAGIVSARNRDINSGPYDNYIQTDAAINRGNSGGPLFNLDGEVIGVNTAIISPSGGSIGIGFAVPSKTVMAVVDQLRTFKEVRRGWLGVRIQQVTDEIGESLNIKPVRGALIAGVDDKGPAKPAGIEPGDVVVKFDGKDIKEMKDLPRAVADSPVGKAVDVIIIRKGKEETRKVTLGRLDDGEKPIEASAKTTAPVEAEKPVTQKALGPRSCRSQQGFAHALQDQGQRQGRDRHRRRQRFRRSRQALERGRRHRRGRAGSRDQRGRCQKAHRPVEEGRQEVCAAAGVERRRRSALRCAGGEVRNSRPSFPFPLRERGRFHPATNSSRR